MAWNHASFHINIRIRTSAGGTGPSRVSGVQATAVGAALLPTVAASVSGAGPTPGVTGDRAAMLTAGLAALAATAVAWHAARLRTAG